MRGVPPAGPWLLRFLCRVLVLKRHLRLQNNIKPKLTPGGAALVDSRPDFKYPAWADARRHEGGRLDQAHKYVGDIEFVLAVGSFFGVHVGARGLLDFPPQARDKGPGRAERAGLSIPRAVYPGID